MTKKAKDIDWSYLEAIEANMEKGQAPDVSDTLFMLDALCKARVKLKELSKVRSRVRALKKELDGRPYPIVRGIFGADYT